MGSGFQHCHVRRAPSRLGGIYTRQTNASFMLFMLIALPANLAIPLS